MTKNLFELFLATIIFSLVSPSDIIFATDKLGEASTLLYELQSSILPGDSLTAQYNWNNEKATGFTDSTSWKVKSCLYGCRTIGTDPEQVTTALPVTLPCSLLVCPPCSCVSKFISVTGCPLVKTITPDPTSITITANFTITFITVTVTVSDCTVTTCPTTATTTIFSTSTSTSTRPQTTITITSTLTTTRSTSTTKITPDICGCPQGYRDQNIPSSLPTITCPGVGCQTKTIQCAPCQAKCSIAIQKPDTNAYRGGSCQQFDNIFQELARINKDAQQRTTGVSKSNSCSTFIICDRGFSCPGSPDLMPHAVSNFIGSQYDDGVFIATPSEGENILTMQSKELNYEAAENKKTVDMESPRRNQTNSRVDLVPKAMFFILFAIITSIYFF